MAKSCAAHGYTLADYAALGWTHGWAPGGDLPSSGGLVVAPLNLGESYYAWSLSPAQPGPVTRWVFTMDAEMVDHPVIQVTCMLAGTSVDTDSTILSRTWTDVMTISTRQIYTWTQPPRDFSRAYPLNVIGLLSADYVAGAKGFLRIYSFCATPEGEVEAPPSTAIPLRQSSRTDGLVGTGRQGHPSLRQGRISGPATIPGGGA